jgi:predicted ester cyclase
MSEGIRTAVRHAWEEAWNKGNLDALDEVCDADMVRHEPPFPDIVGTEALKQYIAAGRSAYSDIKFTFDEIIVKGHRTATRWTWRGKHTGQHPALPIPPTGKQVMLTGSSIDHLAGGKSVEQWIYGDYLGLFQQLGVVPPLTEGGE